MVASELARLLAEHDVLSLDVFDTAILRLVARPTDLFHLVEASFRREAPEATQARLHCGAHRRRGACTTSSTPA